MDSWWAPDPPGTINPAKLSRQIGAPPDTVEGFQASCPPTHFDKETTPEAARQIIPSAAPRPTVPRSAAPLPRISSDWDPEHDIVVHGTSRHQNMQMGFEDFHVPKRRPIAARVRRSSHRGHFRSQTEGGMRVQVPVDLSAGPGATVVIHGATASIYDAYFLKADILKNENMFRRHQIVFNPESQMYTLLAREGRVGLQGLGRPEMELSDLKPVAAKFCKMFREMTATTWNRRYEPNLGLDRHFMFVELDYRGITGRPKDFPNYEVVDANVEEELRDLMEDMLYGGPVRKHNGSQNPGTSRSCSAFSAPYEHLGPWTIFSAFKTLERIWKYLESGGPIHWKAILRASSRYRSQIPFCAEQDRPPVISSYHAIFLELKFLHSFWPRQEIVTMLTDIHRRGSLQQSAYKTLAQPLHQAYSSLRHGFRRLTDPSTFEFRELNNYLVKSCQRQHGLKMELQDIYRVFVKAKLPNPYHDWINAKRSHDIRGADRLLLWHGTPLDSLLGILDLGLQIRRRGASWTGTMFGNGIYLADTSSKSASFCKHQTSDGEAVLLLCEADVGKSRLRSVKSIANGHDIIKKSEGLHRCIEGLGRVGPSAWKGVEWVMGGLPCARSGEVFMPDTLFPYTTNPSGAMLGYNEYVVYDPSHVLIRYLFRVKVKY